MENAPLIPVSWGELIDKITILEIKKRRAPNPDVEVNIVNALVPLLKARGRIPEKLRSFVEELAKINEYLFDLEDQIRHDIDTKNFGSMGFIWRAVSVRYANDNRAKLKHRIDEAMGSLITEVKIYPSRDKSHAAT